MSYRPCGGDVKMGFQSAELIPRNILNDKNIKYILNIKIIFHHYRMRSYYILPSQSPRSDRRWLPFGSKLQMAAEFDSQHAVLLSPWPPKLILNESALWLQSSAALFSSPADTEQSNRDTTHTSALACDAPGNAREAIFRRRKVMDVM